MAEYFLGYDLGSSSVKVSLVEAETGSVAASATSPEEEMEIVSQKEGWAEQDPNNWWQNIVKATHKVLSASDVKSESILAIGIAYQMHGLVIVDKNYEVLRPSIIWCDSRAVEIGDHAYKELGETYCLNTLLNSPGNFTLSKLKWVKNNEPDIYSKIHKVMLPGDYIAMRMTGEIATTNSGLSEGVMWDYQRETLAEKLFSYYGIETELIARQVPTFSDQGKLTASAAEALKLKAGTPITYRSGDQPNNAFSLNTLHPGEIAATAGTSGVIYGIVNKPASDKFSRVNTFVHVNHTKEIQRLGMLLCVNGTGSLNRWLKSILQLTHGNIGYEQMNNLAAQSPVGADNLSILPFGNGAERMLHNANLGASFHGLNFNRHKPQHVCRAVQEGIVFALGYGFEMLNKLGIESTAIRAGNANMFLSDVFCETFANVTGSELQLYNSDGSQGAARGAGVGVKYYTNINEAFKNLTCIKSYEYNREIQYTYLDAYERWKKILSQQPNMITL